MFGREWSFEGIQANLIRLGGDEAPLPHPETQGSIRRSDAGFVLIPAQGFECPRVNGREVTGPVILRTGDQLMASGAVLLWSEETVVARIGNPRPMPREEGLSSVYKGLKKLFRRLGLFRTAEPIA